MADEDEEECEELNVQSEKFNALHALYSSKTVVPFPSAPVLDNVAKATSLLARNQDLVNTPSLSARQKREVKSSASANAAATATATAETETKTGTSKKPQKNVFTRMEEMKGPLAFLKTCMEKRIRVKVWTRTARGIRGYCLGFVVAFDKHWNLVLEDVREVWTRRVKRKQFLLGEAPNEMPLAWKAMGPMVKPPKVVVTGGRRGTEHCERHINQMLMRARAAAEAQVRDQLLQVARHRRVRESGHSGECCRVHQQRQRGHGEHRQRRPRLCLNCTRLTHFQFMLYLNQINVYHVKNSFVLCLSSPHMTPPKNVKQQRNSTVEVQPNLKF